MRQGVLYFDNIGRKDRLLLDVKKCLRSLTLYGDNLTNLPLGLLASLPNLELVAFGSNRFSEEEKQRILAKYGSAFDITF